MPAHAPEPELAYAGAPAPAGPPAPPAPVGAAADGPLYMELDAFDNKPPQRVDVKKLAPFGWGPAVILALIGFVDKAEGSIVGGTLTQLKEEFGFTDFLSGLLFSAPSFMAILLLVPAGIFADTRRRKDVLVIVVILWSILSFGSAAAPTLAVFFTLRLLIGTAAPLNVPATASLLGDFYPLRARARGFSIVRAVENAGLPAGTLIGAVVGQYVGWRAAFVVVGIPGLLLAFLIYKMLQEPKRGIGDDISVLSGDTPARTVEAIAPGGNAASETLEPPQLGADGPPVFAAAGPPGATAPAKGSFSSELALRVGEFLTRLRQIFLIPTVKLLVLGEAILFASFAGTFAFATDFFAETYFKEPGQEAETAGAGLLVAGGSLPFIFIGAYLASQIDIRYTKNNPAMRIRVSLIALIIGAVAITGFILSDPLVPRTAFFYVFATVNIIAVANLAAAVADVIPARIRGSGFATLQVCLALGGSAGPMIIGIGSSLGGEDQRWGFALLLIPLLYGAYTIGQARVTYPKDVAAVAREASEGERRYDPLEGRGTNRQAAASVFCAIACVPLIPLAPLIGLAGVILGSRALKEIKVSPQYGRGMAIAGIWLNAAFAIGGLVLIRAILG